VAAAVLRRAHWQAVSSEIALNVRLGWYMAASGRPLKPADLSGRTLWPAAPRRRYLFLHTRKFATENSIGRISMKHYSTIRSRRISETKTPLPIYPPVIDRVPGSRSYASLPGQMGSGEARPGAPPNIAGPHSRWAQVLLLRAISVES